MRTMLVAVLLDQGHARFCSLSPGHGVAHLHEMHVDLVDDLEVARQNALEERHTPPLERLRQQRVVRVAEGPRDDLPGLLPRQILLVDQHAHQLGDGHGGVRVVELDRDLVGKVVPRIAGLLAVAPDDVAQRAGDEEILLHEAQLLAVLGLVVRVEDLGDGLARPPSRARPRRSRRG